MPRRSAVLFVSFLCPVALAWGCGSDDAPTTSLPAVDVVVDAVQDVEPEVASDLTTPPDVGADVEAEVDAVPDVEPDVDAADLPDPVTVPTDLPPGVQAVHLGQVPFDEVGKSPDLKLNLPAETVGWLAIVQGAHPGIFGISKIISPKGEMLAKGKCVTDVCVDCKNRVGMSPATGAAILPSSTGVKAQSGNYFLQSCGFHWLKQGNQYSPNPYTMGPITTTAFVKTAAGGAVPDQGRVLLRFFFTGGGQLQAADAPTDPRIIGMLAQVTALYGAVGLTVEVVDWQDTAPGFTVVHLAEDLTTTGASDLDLLFAQAAPFGGSAVVDVFFVDQLIGGTESKGVVGGVAGGVPGPAFYNGIPRAGVAIAIASLGGDPVWLGRTLGHEVGHFLGLWHPSEGDGKAFDPLEDTPQCGFAQDADQDGAVSVEECVTLGADNLMFWSLGSPTASLSPEQGRVQRSNPVVWPANPPF
jgi:hypothetical protein